ncbi:MAG: NDP-sugar synthase [Muribaculaceae bacterium]|nr:NDP-sugar synthase [Muribaculaceae bacterium]
MDYVILAGGLGSRFVKEGYECPKPMVPLFGEPMIGVLIRTLMKCGAEHIHVGANARMQALLDYLEELKGTGLPIIVKPIITDNSYCTLKAASEGIEGKFIAMTCDAIFPTDEFREYVKAVEDAPADVALMGLTRFVEDESPLYARISESGEVIDYRYGGEPFAEGVIVSAGLYGLSGRIMATIPELGLEPESLSDYQRLLAVKTPVAVKPYEFSIAFDVDNTRDRLHAEEFLAKYQ